MDYACEGDLLQKIQEHTKKGTYMKEEDIWNIFIQIVKGLKSMHDMNIMHRDMKSANVFLYDEKVAKLGDFNVSKLQKKSLLYTQTGTPYYASPEVWKDMPYDKKADIWSLGCVLYEMAALRPPFKAEDMQALYKKITSGKFSRIPDFYSNDLMYVINQLLQVQPYYRPSCNQILKNNVVKKYIQERHLFEVEEKSILLSTIKFPKDLKQVELPKSNYSPIKLKRLSQQVKTLENENNIESAEDLKSQRLLTETDHSNEDTHRKKNLPQVNDSMKSKDNPLNEYRVENLYHKGQGRHRNASIKKSAQQLSNENSPLPSIQNQRKLSLSISKNNVCTIASSQKEAEVRQILKSNTNGTSNISSMSYNVQDDRQNYLALKQFIIKQKGKSNRNISPLQQSSQTPEKIEKMINNSVNYSNNNIIKNNSHNQSSNQRMLPTNISKDYEPTKPTFKINCKIKQLESYLDSHNLQQILDRQQTLSPNLSVKKPTTERQNVNLQNTPEVVSPYKLLPKIYSSSINQQMAINKSGLDVYVKGAYQNKVKKRVYSNQATLNYDGSQELSYEEPSYYKLNQTKDLNDQAYQDQDFSIRTPSQNKKKIKYQSVDNNNSFLNHQKIKDQIILKSKDVTNNLSIISADDISTKQKRRNSHHKLKNSIEKRSSRQNHFKDKDHSNSNINNNSNILVQVDDQQI